MGSAGEYSDRTEWAICSFFDEKKAQEYVIKATEKINEMIIYHKNNFDYEYDGWKKTKKQIENKYDHMV